MLRGPGGRLWEVDLARGIAVMLMIAFHVLFDISYFAGYPAQLSDGLWWLIARTSATTFIFLVGVSMTLSYSRLTDKRMRAMVRKYAARGLRIFLLGMAITAVTYVFLNEGTIWFGVLHLIGASIALTFPLLGHKRAGLATALIILAAGFLT
ncbi:MAG: DUF1624 domain-containing protein, partial [Candidatus Aenigmatarchaeota archaeon]